MPWGSGGRAGRRNYILARPAAGQPQVYLHRLVAEKALGKPLPPNAVVHHQGDAPAAGLVICQDQSYHGLLHRRLKVLRAGGDPNIDKVCSRCRCVKSQTLFGANKSTHDGLSTRCRDCQTIINTDVTERRLRVATTLVIVNGEHRNAACNVNGEPTQYQNYTSAERRLNVFNTAGLAAEVVREVTDPHPFKGSRFYVCTLIESS